MNKIVYAEDLARELLKHPRTFVVIGEQKSLFTYRDDRKVSSLFLKDGETLVLVPGEYNTNGELKYFAE